MIFFKVAENKWDCANNALAQWKSARYNYAEKPQFELSRPGYSGIPREMSKHNTGRIVTTETLRKHLKETISLYQIMINRAKRALDEFERIEQKK